MTAQAGSIIPAGTSERRQLRQQLRRQRRELPPSYRRTADRAIQTVLRRLPEFHRARHVAVFVAFDGEPSLEALVTDALRRGKRLYAPVLRGATMTFREIEQRGAFKPNWFGILEPTLGNAIDARRLDLVLTPLVAFDDRGTRLGVGRGYYDRRFAFLKHRARWRRPKLFGVAYELQHVPSLAANPWDVPLYGVVTEARVRRFLLGADRA